jgi:hypothetical protein
MKLKVICFWVSTAFVAFMYVFGGVMDFMRGPEVVAGLASLGYPAYLGAILGVWKLFGVVALLAPGLPRLKEWVYAGMVFNLTGAAASHLYSGDTPDKVLTPIVLLAFVAASYALRPPSRVLGQLFGAAKPAPAPAAGSAPALS